MRAAVLENGGTKLMLISLLERGFRIKEGRSASVPHTKEGLHEYVSPLRSHVKWKCCNCHDLMNGLLLPGHIAYLVLL